MYKRTFNATEKDRSVVVSAVSSNERGGLSGVQLRREILSRILRKRVRFDYGRCYHQRTLIFSTPETFPVKGSFALGSQQCDVNQHCTHRSAAIE